MVSILDEAIGNITESLKENGLFEDTVIIFSTDVSVNFSLNFCCFFYKHFILNSHCKQISLFMVKL